MPHPRGILTHFGKRKLAKHQLCSTEIVGSFVLGLNLALAISHRCSYVEEVDLCKDNTYANTLLYFIRNNIADPMWETYELIKVRYLDIQFQKQDHIPSRLAHVRPVGCIVVYVPEWVMESHENEYVNKYNVRTR